MNKAYLLISLFLVVFSNSSLAQCDRSLDQPSLTQRRECIREDIQGEIERAQALKLEAAKIEVEARMAILKSSQSNNTNINSNTLSSSNNLKQDITNK